MSLAEGLLATIEEINNLDRKLARDIGQHIDNQSRTLAALRDELDAKTFAPEAFRLLPPAQHEAFERLKVAELRAIATRMNLPNRSKQKRKAEIIQFLIDNRAPLAPSYEQLLAFWVEHKVRGQSAL
jgi:hypothetical protein